MPHYHFNQRCFGIQTIRPSLYRLMIYDIASINIRQRFKCQALTFFFAYFLHIRHKIFIRTFNGRALKTNGNGMF